MVGESKKISVKFAWSIWFLCALFYFYEYALRTSPGIMLPELSSYFSISYASLGILISAYFFSYAPMQLVAGALMDGYGGKKLLPLSVLFCAIGSFLFIQHSFDIALIGRLLIGAGAAFGFVGIIYIATNWINKKHLSLIIGLTQTLGMFGAIAGQVFMAKIEKYQSWFAVWWYYVVFGFVLFIILICIIPKRPKELDEYQKEHKGKLIYNLISIFKNRHTIIIASVGGLLFIPTTVIAMLWGIPFLTGLYGITRIEASHIMMFVFIGWIVGCPIVGYVDDKFNKHKLLMLFGLVVTFILFMIFAYVNIGINASCILLFFIGFFSSVQILTFTIVEESNPIHLKGSVLGATNFVIFMWTAILTPVFGYVLRDVMQSFPHGNIVADYRLTMLLVPLSLMIAGGMLFTTRKYKVKQQTL
ncbi:MAG TPA: MFS transporter [Victivallales bacterium]|nr:MFS transporter [Victivallales bacterium]